MVIGFNFPTDIKWERLCVTPDMMFLSNDLNDFPPKWNSSVALFKYVPEEEYQVYVGRKITYLKVVCTITGYQKKNYEIEGEVPWDKLNYDDGEDLDVLLKTYDPCHGAILQVAVMPPKLPPVHVGGTLTIGQILNLPYIMDFQPKKREMFEAASDTNEFSSGSLKTTTTGKASGKADGGEYLYCHLRYLVSANMHI